MFVIALAGVLCAMSEAKERPTYYTPQRMKIGRENLARYDWAKAEFDLILKGQGFRYMTGYKYGPAAVYAEKSDEFMWMLQPTTRIARFVPRKFTARCPVHGTKPREFDPHCGYRIDPIARPYKVQCMAGGEWYPSNDYAAGDMTSGEFADDGSGCTHKGETYYFLRSYAHMAYGSAVIQALRSLSQAYVLTGEAKYGRKGAILLARLAAEYPNHDDRKDRLYYALYDFHDPEVDWKIGGMITDLIWETFCLEATAYAYDGLYSYMDQDAEMLAFLKGKGMPIETGGDLRRYIEQHILRTGMDGLLRGNIHGNEGHHQSAAMACALVLDDYSDTHPNSKDMVDYMVRWRHPVFHTGNSADILTNGLTRKGGGHESPNYNTIKCDFIRVNRLMDQVRARRPDLFPLDKYPDLFGGEKARRLFDFFIDVMILDTFLPSIGDSGGIYPMRRAKPHGYSYLRAEYLYAFERYGDPRHARACTAYEGKTVPKGELFERYLAEEIEAALARPESRITRESRVLDGYGLGILESGRGEDGRAALLNYASLIGHRQCDHLSLLLFARGVDLLPDLGYPFSWEYRWTWDSNSMAHNTVTVDETQPVQDIGGQGWVFASADGVHVISASHDPYPAGRIALGKPDAKMTDLYQRTVLLVDVDPKRFYVVDLFAVNGGEQHDQSWHGPLVKVEPPALEWRAQGGGTLAGEDVEQFAEWTDRWGRKRKDFPAFLVDVRRATLDQPATWTWKTGLPEGDTLRLHLVPVGEPMELIHGRGRSPVRPKDWWLDYVIARRHVKDGAASRFLTVLEAFQSAPVVKGVRLVSQRPLVLEVTRDDGVDLIHLNVPTRSSRSTAHRAMGVRVESRTNGQATRDVEVGLWAPDKGPGYAEGTIAALDYAANRIALADAPGLETDFAPGRAIRIFNKDRSALYRVVKTGRASGQFRITLDATALLARGPVVGAADGRLMLDTELVFANGRTDGDGELLDRRDYFAGSWLGDGSSARQLRGAAQASKCTLFLKGPAGEKMLVQRYGGRTVSIWQYGVGDRVEVARSRGL